MCAVVVGGDCGCGGGVSKYYLELITDLVFLVGIGWYFLGILPTNTEGKLGWYIRLIDQKGHISVCAGSC